MSKKVPARSAKALPSRPDLDQLRRQSKQLLAALRAGDAAAVDTFREQLPEARGLTAAQVREAGYRLADAQSAVARRTGFASWPALAHHVQTLRALEGEWRFASLEVDGNGVPAAMLGASRLLIDGDRFRTESPEATYEGEFTIDVEARPCAIDIEFVEGPEAGNWSYGVFELTGDTLQLCVGLTGAPRPVAFATTPGSRHALEVLTRASAARPAGVSGGTRGTRSAKAATPAAEAVAFEAPVTETTRALHGEWQPLELVRDGKAMPAMMLRAGKRVAEGNEMRVIFGGQTMVHARVRYHAGTTPLHVDYLYLAGETAGQVALGIAEHADGELRVLMAPPGAPRPDEWSCEPGSGRTLSRWKRK